MLLKKGGMRETVSRKVNLQLNLFLPLCVEVLAN